MHRIKDFVCVFRMYAKHHPIPYAARMAYGMAFKNLPF